MGGLGGAIMSLSEYIEDQSPINWKKMLARIIVGLFSGCVFGSLFYSINASISMIIFMSSFAGVGGPAAIKIGIALFKAKTEQK